MSAPTDESAHTISNSAAEFDESTEDPRDFYRTYQDSHGDSPSRGFHQDALRTSGFDDDFSQTRRRKSSAASAQSQDGRRLRSSRSSGAGQQLSVVTNTGSMPQKTLTSRKASFRDLVARFDSSPDDVPPMPSHPASLSNSTKPSPVVRSNPHQNSFHSPRKLSHDVHTYRHPSNPTQARSTQADMSLHPNSRQYRPLFGEVLSGGMGSTTAGYGIANPRRRSGSEGSPMHSPNPMFPGSARPYPDTSAFQSSQEQSQTNLSPGASEGSRAYHRRANSDFSSTSTISRIPRSTAGLTETPNVESGRLLPDRMSGSKIPVSTRRQSLTSESGPSNSSSRAESKVGHYRPPSSHNTESKPTSATGNGQRSAPGRRHRPAAHIQSPSKNRRNINISQGEKSPSLRANIIAPPPKISPPLRGSRQRLPVSSASTAASRARMAEKFQMMAREQSDRRSASRRARPPELTDIDFDARRLKITQALSRSREGQDLRGDLSGGTRKSSSRVHSKEPSMSELDETSETHFGSPEVPTLLVQSPGVESDGDVYKTPTEEGPFHQSTFAQTALRALSTQQTFAGDDDSPTRGQPDEDTNLEHSDESIDSHDPSRDLEPESAITEATIDTVSTPIDAEPQPGEGEQTGSNLSLLNHITSMRQHGFNTPPSALSQSGEHSLDRTDAESVQLFLRNTTYNMDEEEAVAKGYRDFLPPPPVPQLSRSPAAERSSWTSSIEGRSETSPDDEVVASRNDRDFEGHPETSELQSHDNSSQLDPDPPESSDESTRNTAASDTYTIINIVLQDQSSSGVVDQQLVDDIYRRILTEEPQIIESNILDEHRIVELCLRELEEYNEALWRGEGDNEITREPQDYSVPADSQQPSDGNEARSHEAPSVDDDQPPPAPPKDIYPPPAFQTHKYKSSLDSAEDWADTSPSVGDWMQFALNRGTETAKPKETSPLSQDAESSAGNAELSERVSQGSLLRHDSQTPRVTSPPPRAPSHSPPLPPDHNLPSIEQTSLAFLDRTALAEGPQIPRRITSPAQMFGVPQQDLPPAMSEQPPHAETRNEEEGPDQRRLKQRRHVLKELVDTEFNYERDLRVLCDIYKQTALAALSEEDVKILFGNVDEVQQFAKDFLSDLKQAAKPAYVMERQDRRKDLPQAPNPTSDHVSIRTGQSDMSDAEKDRLTRVGQAFESSMTSMETVYKEYIRGRHAANQRLQQVQSLPGVREWLKECSENSSDITNAWSLDALLVKPIQRITKYPLLLSQFLESTAADHPDHNQLRSAFSNVTEINIRINEVKKHTEIVDSVMRRKRKESDVRAGLTKAFGRRAEKLRQHVGINEAYEDGEYGRLKMDYDNNGVHLLIVSKDCQGYIDSIKAWVLRMVEMAAAAEAWLDVGHSNHPEAESKLRQLAMAVRGINTIALPDHTELVLRKVIQPMEKTIVMMERFKTDPKGLIMKREKKIVDYNQAKNKKDRGEKLDRKMIERMEQWEAINVEVKQRMRKLLASSTDLVQSCLKVLVQLHMGWLAVVEQKFAAAMAIPIDGLEHLDLVKEWQEDFDFQHAFAMSLGICNGSLLAEAMNLMSFLTPGSTMTGEESPRHSSWNSGAKRSISINSEVDTGARYGDGPRSSHGDFPPQGSPFGQNSARNRATSLASGRTARTPEMSGRGTGLSVNLPNGGPLARPGTSPGRTEESSTGAPRVSLDAPSPSLGNFRVPSPARPGSASTFFSAAPGPSNYASQPISGGSSIFSSAMPLSDSPEMERNPGVGMGEDEPEVLFTAASVYEFNIDRARQEGGIPYLTYVAGEIFDVIGERGELWLARNQDDPNRQVGWIWNKHFAKLAS